LIGVFARDSAWVEWSDRALIRAGDDGAVFVDPVIYAEISVGFPTIEECEWAVEAKGIERVPLPWPAAFLAGRAFIDYRRRGGGLKRSPLPDFYIGAHAAVAGLRLLTRDPDRFRTYFPTVELITPE
jgi:predicted nucleic acid-binding protein